MFTDKGSGGNRIESAFPHKRIEVRQGILERPVAIDGHQHGRTMVLTDYIVELPFGAMSDLKELPTIRSYEDYYRSISLKNRAT